MVCVLSLAWFDLDSIFVLDIPHVRVLVQSVDSLNDSYVQLSSPILHRLHLAEIKSSILRVDLGHFAFYFLFYVISCFRAGCHPSLCGQDPHVSPITTYCGPKYRTKVQDPSTGA